MWYEIFSYGISGSVLKNINDLNLRYISSKNLGLNRWSYGCFHF